MTRQPIVFPAELSRTRPATGCGGDLQLCGAPPGSIVLVDATNRLPAAPRRSAWRPLSQLTVSEIRARADRYRTLAAAAAAGGAATSLAALAQRFDSLAAQREAADAAKVPHCTREWDED